jgi:zinc protease
LASFQTFTGNPNKIQELISMYRSVTKEDVQRVYFQYIKNAHGVVLSIAPKGQEKNLVADDNYVVDKNNYKAPDYGYTGLKYNKAKDKFDRSKEPGNGPNPVVKVPAFWKKNMENGVTVIGTQSLELPTVTLSIKIPGGHLLHTNNLEKAGVADFFATMMNEDTKKHTAEEMSRALQKLGSSVSVFSGMDGITFQVFTLKKNLDATLTLLEERMLMPRFTEDAFKRLKNQTIEGFKQQKSQPSAVADLVFTKLNYGKSIMGISGDGNETTVKAMKLDDIQNYYDNNMTSQGVNVVVVGDITESEVMQKLSFLNKLPNKKIEMPTPPAAPAIEKTKIYLVNIPNAAQTEFRIGTVTGLKYDATGEYYKAGLMNYPLGDAFNSRLNLKLREDKGWSYGAGSGFDGDNYTGTFEFGSAIKVDATDSALVETMNEFKNYVANGITAEELTFTKNAIGQRDALKYETGFQKAGFISRILEYNLPADFTTQQTQVLKNITAAEINALAKKYINVDKMNILLVGDKAKILPGLQKLGYEIVELDVDGNVKK